MIDLLAVEEPKPKPAKVHRRSPKHGSVRLTIRQQPPNDFCNKIGQEKTSRSACAVRQFLPTTQRKFTGSAVRRKPWPCISNRDEQPARATFRRTPPTSVYSPISTRV